MKFIASTFCAAALAALSFSVQAETAAHAEAKVDLANGQAKFGACAACHAADGNSTIPANPKLAQQHPEYLVKQLKEFQSGKRDNAIMKPMASMLNEQDMVDVAAFLAQQPAKGGYAMDKDTVRLGERIYRGGIPDRQIAACAGCHSPNGAGIPAQYPRLSGQHAAYTEAQLKGFRDGTRANSAPMAGVAAKMNDKEIKAVADYIAGLR